MAWGHIKVTGQPYSTYTVIHCHILCHNLSYTLSLSYSVKRSLTIYKPSSSRNQSTRCLTLFNAKGEESLAVRPCNQYTLYYIHLSFICTYYNTLSYLIMILMIQDILCNLNWGVQLRLSDNVV